MSTIYEFVVIGGGITGLTAGNTCTELFKNGIVVGGQELGGEVKSLILDGFTLELGANTLVLKPELQSLLKKLGLEQRVTRPDVTPIRQYVVHNEKVHEVPKSLFSFVTSSLLTISEKKDLLVGLFKKLPPLADTASVFELVSKIVGMGATKKVLCPVLRGIFGGDAQRLSAKATFGPLFEHMATGGTLFGYLKNKEKRELFHIQGGNSLLCDALREGLRETVKQSQVVSLVRDENNRFKIIDSVGNIYLTKRVIVTTSGDRTANFVSQIGPSLIKPLRALRYAPINVIHFSVSSDTTLPKEGFGVLFPKESRASIIGVLFNSQVFPDMAPDGTHLLTVCLGGIDSSSTQQDQTLLIANAKEDLHRYFAIRDPKLLSTHYWPAAIPQYEENFFELQRQLDEVEAQHPGLYFIGTDRGGVGVPDRVTWATAILSAKLQTPLHHV